MTRGNKKFGLKVAILILTLGIILTGIVGTTLAWLVADTDPVKNVFVVGKISITLTETESNPNGEGNNTYTMVPGTEIEKDPTLTVKAGSEACWLFVKIDESANLDEFIEYEVDSAWTLVPNQTNVYYIKAETKTTQDTDYAIIKNNKVSVLESVTSDALNSLTDATYPTMTFTGYAVQLGTHEDINDVESAWALALDAQNNP